MKNKKAISLIVLVITILVLSILATTVIISLSNSNVISEANDAVNKYNLKQMEMSVQLEQASMMLESGGKKPNTFDLIEKLYTNNQITESQKAELIANGGELELDGEILRLDTDSVVTFDGNEYFKMEDGTYKLRFKYTIYKLPNVENLEYDEIGFVVLPQDLVDNYSPEIAIEEKFKLDAEEKYGMPVAKVIVKYGSEDDEKIQTNLGLTGINEEGKSRVYMSRVYIKYTYNGVSGVLYSDVNNSSFDGAVEVDE